MNKTPELDAQAPPAVLQVEGLTFSYPQNPLFTGLSVRIAPGLTLLCGGDGRGKSTLLRLLAGVLPAQAGYLRLRGINLHEQAPHYQQHVFWADPQSEAWEQLSALDYFKAMQRRYTSFDMSLVNELAQGLSLVPHLEKPLYMLSTGSKRKVWLAAAFASGAEVTLLDEPFAALDKTSIDFVMDLLADAARHPQRAWVMAHYGPPGDVPLAGTIDLGD